MSAPPALRLASAWGRPLLIATCLACAGLGLAAALGAAIPTLVSICALALLSTLIVAGVAFHQSGVFGRPLVFVATGRPEVALTFDDGPDPGSTPALLDALDAGGHRATFFVIGERAARHPALLAELARRGHQVENHSWSHGWATPFQSPRRLAAALEQANALIAQACRRRPRWFRPPVGLLSPRVVEAARLAGLELVGWTATARDGVARTTAKAALARLSNHLRPGAVLVLHDGAVRGSRTPVAAAVLPPLLALLEARQLRSVTLSELVDGSRAAGCPAAADPGGGGGPQRGPDDDPQRDAADAEVDEERL